MKKLIIIPARYASTRYPGKPLVNLTGYTGQNKTLIRRSWEAAKTVRRIDKIVVATDDTRIKSEVESFGGEVIMTSDTCRNGTERCAEVAAKFPDYDLIVNLQGDAPLTPSWFIEELISALESDKKHNVATPVLKCDVKALYDFIEDRKAGRVGGTTVAFSKNYRAMYFSKEVIPYTGNNVKNDNEVPVYHHVGVYAYRNKILQNYMRLPEGIMEKWEGLEQLRFLENDINIKCVEVNSKGRHFWELNNPEDVNRIEAVLEKHAVV